MLTILSTASEIKSFETTIINDFILKIVDDMMFTDLDKPTFTKGVLLALHEFEFLIH